MRHVHKWITLVEYRDIETGEIITKSMYERGYYTVKTEKETEIKEVQLHNELKTYGYKMYRKDVRKKQEQLRLFE